VEEIDANVVDDNDISYGKSDKGFELMNGYHLLRESDHYQQIRIRGQYLFITYINT